MKLVQRKRFEGGIFVKMMLCLLLVLPMMASCSDNDSDSSLGTADDDYCGVSLSLQVKEQTAKLEEKQLVCRIAAPDGSIIKRDCSHTRRDGVSTIAMPVGLKNGEYRLLSFEYTLPTPEGEHGEYTTAHYGLGFRIMVNNGKATILDRYNSDYEMSGSGTKDDPFLITSYPHLMKLAVMANKGKTDGVYFKQADDINLGYASYLCSHTDGWLPIGSSTNSAFSGYYDGNGKAVSGIKCNRPNSLGIGLFGFIEQASIKRVTVKDSQFAGNFAVGAVAGMILSAGGTRNVSMLDSCFVSNCTVTGSENSVSVGGVLGGIDLYARGNIYDCHTDSATSVSADYNTGGVVGASGVYTATLISECSNAATVTAKYAGAGGIIATADTLHVLTSQNAGHIASGNGGGDIKRGTGGICGGSGVSAFTGCSNSGSVDGKEGVGGILGSTRLGQDDNVACVFNNTYLRYCQNSGTVTGDNSVGGLCGEAQFGCFGSLNTGKVTGKDYVGGAAGYTSVAVVHNSANSGAIYGNSYVSGIVGKSNMGSYAMCQNFNSVVGSGRHVAGIVGLTANNTVIHYCGNFGYVKGGLDYVGGIVGEIGEEKEMEAIDIAECVFGSLEIISSFVGPVCAVVEGAYEGAKTAVMAVEISTEAIMKIGSLVMNGFTIAEICEPHELEDKELAITAGLKARQDEVMTSLKALRNNATMASSIFAMQPISEYGGAMNNLSDWLTAEDGGDETNNTTFCNNINELRHEIAEDVEDMNKSRELTFLAASGVFFVISTAAFIGSVATGGAALPVCLGVFSGVVGGSLSIVKGTTNYPENIVAVTQCVNTGNVESESKSDLTGGIGGRISHRAKVNDCLNTGEGNGDGGHMAGYLGADAEFVRCLSIADAGSWDGICENYGTSIYMNQVYYCADKNEYARGTRLTAGEVSNTSSYGGWQMDTDKKWWTLPAVTAGQTFPVPYNSQMK